MNTLFDQILADLKLEASKSRFWCASGNVRNQYNLDQPNATEITNQLEHESFLGMVVVQDCNMGGEYWRYFIWNNENDHDDPDRLNRTFYVGRWIMPREFESRLVKWKDGEVVTTDHGRAVSTTLFHESGARERDENKYIWVVRPVDTNVHRTCLVMDR